MSEKIKKNATLEDVAKLAGVGKGTVDRVVHNRGIVSSETRKKVEDALQQLDYKPNISARMLAKRKLYRIAITYHNEEEEFWDQVEEGLDRAEETYSRMGVQFDRYVLPKLDAAGQVKVIEKVIEQKYDGLALVPYMNVKVQEALTKAVRSGIRVVVFNNEEKCENSIYVGDNTYQSGRSAGNIMSLIAKPNSNYVVFAPDEKIMESLEHRIKGFIEVIGEKRPDMHLLEVFYAHNDYDNAYIETRRLFRDQIPVDAFYAVNPVSVPVARAVVEAGMQEKIRFVSHDLTPSINRYLKEGVIDVSIGQEPDRQGFLALDLLCRQLLQDEVISQDKYTKIVIAVSENINYLSE